MRFAKLEDLCIINPTDYKKNPKHKIKIIEVKKEEKIILSKTSTKILKGLI